jgi:hypothetical protein
MSASISIKGIEAFFKSAAKEREKLTKEQAKKMVESMTSDLVLATPIDTGKARASWSFTPTKDGFDITNSTSYIQYLNAGSSKQAPDNFIERIALVYGRPVGQIVEVTD